jgi:hypothetical protein
LKLVYATIDEVWRLKALAGVLEREVFSKKAHLEEVVKAINKGK